MTNAENLYRLIKEPLLRRLWRRHANRLVPVSEDVIALFKEDNFSLSQVLLGNAYYKARIEKIFATLPEKKNLLDMGCGAGNWSLAAASVFDGVVGCDVHEQRITLANQLNATCEKRGNVSFMILNVDTLPFPDGHFNAVLCINMLTFIGKPYGPFLKELRRVTSPGGFMYLVAHDSGFCFFLLWQALLHKSRYKLNVWKHAVKHNMQFSRGKKPFPTSWAGARYIIETAENAGWKLVQNGAEGDCMANEQMAMWPRTFWGRPLMREYLLAAI